VSSYGCFMAAWLVDRFGPLIKGCEYELDRTPGQSLTPGLGGAHGGPPLILADPAQSDLLPDWVNLHEVPKSELVTPV
jgi:hypothetical protein